MAIIIGLEYDNGVVVGYSTNQVTKQEISETRGYGSNGKEHKIQLCKDLPVGLGIAPFGLEGQFDDFFSGVLDDRLPELAFEDFVNQYYLEMGQLHSRGLLSQEYLLASSDTLKYASTKNGGTVSSASPYVAIGDYSRAATAYLDAKYPGKDTPFDLAVCHLYEAVQSAKTENLVDTSALETGRSLKGFGITDLRTDSARQLFDPLFTSNQYVSLNKQS